MEITEEYLKQEIENLEKKKLEFVANANAIEGAIFGHKSTLERLLKPIEEKPNADK